MDGHLSKGIADFQLPIEVECMRRTSPVQYSGAVARLSRRALPDQTVRTIDLSTTAPEYDLLNENSCSNEWRCGFIRSRSNS